MPNVLAVNCVDLASQHVHPGILASRPMVVVYKSIMHIRTLLLSNIICIMIFICECECTYTSMYMCIYSVHVRVLALC